MKPFFFLVLALGAFIIYYFYFLKQDFTIIPFKITVQIYDEIYNSNNYK
jgi:hypothetical protein